jgi:hypothetical protein
VQPSHDWLVQARHVLGWHLDDLRESLAVLGERVRDAVGNAVGGSVAKAVHEAVRALLSAPEAIPLRVAGHGSLPAGTRPTGRSAPRAAEESACSSEWPDHHPYEADQPASVSPPIARIIHPQ